MWFLSIIPTIFNTLLGYFTKRIDSEVEKYKVDGSVNIEAMRTDAEIIKAKVQLASARAYDKVDSIGRALFIYPTGIYYALIIYDSAFREIFPSWRILELPDHLKYIPYACIAYLFVTTITRLKK